MKRILFGILVITALLALAGCAGGAGSGQTTQGASSAVESYLQALVTQDTAKLSTLSCKDWEQQALLELDSFQGVTAKVENPGCVESGKDGSASLVKCQGKIVATYNNENQELSLTGRTYKVVQEGGDWRVCGYQ